MTEEPAIDGTAEEIDPAPVSTEVIAVARARERRSEVIRPLDPDELVASFTEYQSLLHRLLDADDWQGKPGQRGSFPKKSAWRKIATAFDLDVTLVGDEVERDESGTVLRAKVIARAVTPGGRIMDGDGYCAADEPRFADQRGRQKLENDLRGTATTRAKNRAIADLVGMGQVSAEEVDTHAAPGGIPAWAAPASDEAKREMVDVLAHVLCDRSTGVEYAKQLADAAGGSMPQLVAAWVAAMPAWISVGTAAVARRAEAEEQAPDRLDLADQAPRAQSAILEGTS